jgi:uncharacterized protein YkwD/LysM repeat protein
MGNFLLLVAYLLTILLTPNAARAAPALAPAAQGSAGEVIALINEYRAQNGLPAFTQDNLLMQLAQGHSDYQASIGQVTHGGPGGTRPIDRAYAAGYGDGQVIFISELVTGGFTQSSQQALEWWKNSPEHNSYLLSDNYFEIGIGVATNGENRYYYTAELGNIAGGSVYVPEDPLAPTSAPQAVIIPVVKAEPRDNGSLVHIVRQGQTLWTISAVYEKPLDAILALNNLSVNSFIFPGDEIIIEPPGTLATLTPTPAPESTATKTSAVTEEELPTRQATVEQLAEVQNTPAPPERQTGQLSAEDKAEVANTTVMLVVGVALLAILGVFGASFFIQRPRPPESPEDDPFAPIE